MGESNIESLAHHFLHDQNAKASYRAINPSSRVISNYVLASNQIKENISCGAQNDCAWSRLPEERSHDDLQQWIICITCDRLYHIRCTGIDVAAQSEEQLPWICFKCMGNPMNPESQALVIESRHLYSFEERIQAFMKEPSIKKLEESIDSDSIMTEVSHSIRIDGTGKIIPESIIAVLQEMQVRMNEQMKQNQALQKIINELQSEKLQSLKAARAENSPVNSKEAFPVSGKQQSAIVKNSDEAKVNTVAASAIGKNINYPTNGKCQESQSKPKTYLETVMKANESILVTNDLYPFDNDTLNRTNFMGNKDQNAENSTPKAARASISASDPLNATIIHMQQLTLNEKRKYLPEIGKFDGRPEKWLTFKSAVERNWSEGEYPDSLMKYQIRKALTGMALARVDPVFEHSSAREILGQLQECFGNSAVIVETARQRLLNTKLSKPLTHVSCFEVTTNIVSYMRACKYAELPMNDMTLAKHIHQQLEPYHQQRYYEMYFEKFPNATMRMERLDVLFDFLDKLDKTLPYGNFKFDDARSHKTKQNYQVMSASYGGPSNAASASNNSNSVQNNENYKFEIRDQETAKYMGYNLNQVNKLPKNCVFCLKNNHYSVECRKYREMKMDARYYNAKSKGLCINCLLTTTHSAKDCDLKTSCGHKIGVNARCTGKHHVSLHRGNGNTFKSNNRTTNNVYKKQQQRARTNYNAARANEIINKSNQQTNEPSNASAQVLQAQIPYSHDNSVITSSKATASVAPKGYPMEPPAIVSTVQQNQSNSYQMCPLTSQICTVNQTSHRTVKMFKTMFYGNQGKRARGYSVGDSAAEITLVKRELIDDLGITGEKCLLDLQWTDSAVKRTEALRVKLKISGDNEQAEIMELDECYAVTDFNLPPRSLNVESLKKKFPYLRKIPFLSYQNAIPSLLIGTKHAYMIEAIEPITQDGNNKPIAIKTKLGYSIYGGALDNFVTTTVSVNSLNIESLKEESDVNEVTNEQLSEIYKFHCSIDSLAIQHKETHLTKDEKSAIEIIEKEMKTLPSGHVEIPLIWNKKDGEIPKLPNNYPMVYKRQLAQENKLKKNPELLEAYNNNFMELIKEGYVRSASERDMKTKWPNIWYLPMSLVVNSNKFPIKTRNVYDASARYQGTSLNDNLLMGPNLLVNILKPLMRLRMYKYAISGDVKSMFHRIRICERDQQVQRILWRQNLNEEMQCFIQQSMLFGPKCSPFSSQIVKNITADKYMDKFPDAASALKELTYMDDLITSEPTVEKAVETARNCIDILKSINWQLVGFTSNSLKVLQALSPENVKQEVIDIMSTEETTYTAKILGVAWNPKVDAFVFQLNKNIFIKLVKECGHKPTKRDQCSTIARIFDALGLISNCTILGKIILQRSWRKKIGWDEEISDEDHVSWLKWLNDLEKVSSLKIPRLRFNKFNMNEAESLELHCFCDAGKEAFAAVAYFVATFNGYRYSSFVMSKAKVAPIKLKTNHEITEMPRLELLSCLIAARLTNTIQEMHKEFNFVTYLWSDNEIALNWAHNENLKLPKFAISPVEEILELTDRNQWNYVDSKHNVADLATKFQRKFDFGDINNLWFQGPNFLKLPKEFWPKQKPKTESVSAMFVGTINEESPLYDCKIQLPPGDCLLARDYFIDLFSNEITSRWPKLVRAVGRALKFYYNAIIPLLKSSQWNDMEARKLIKGNNNFVTLTPIEFERAELFIIRRMQRECYPVEYERLSKNKRIFNRELLQLNVFMDGNGLIRINSRVDLPENAYAQKTAPLVPRKSRFATTLLFHYHYMYKHVGIEAQIAEFRSKYWMPQIRAALLNIQSLCNYCGFRRANPIQYKMSDLPYVRTDIRLKPFEVTGLDCAGPFTVYAKNGQQKKVWMLIFTCTVTRFIQLHVLDDLSSPAVYEAITVLWATQGPVRQFISDNGTNFVGVSRIISNEVKQMVKFLRETEGELAAKLAEEKSTSWIFIPVKSPWFGAFYERLIQTIKKSIASTIEGRKLSRREFNIALQDAAHRINCRPLTHNPISNEDEEVLTPFHLAKKDKDGGWPILPSVHGLRKSPNPAEDREYFRKGRIVAEQIAKRFTSQYLPVLTKRTKWFKDYSPLKVGDLVLVIDPNQTRQAWERARVEKIYKSRDSNARVVDIRLPDGTIRKRRSVKYLAKLEIKQL